MITRLKRLFAKQGLQASPTAGPPALAADGYGRIPPGLRVYAVGDIHGRADLLETLLEQIRRDAATFKGECVLVFAGDYIDRGPESARVVDILLHGLPKGWSITFLCGNHEDAMLTFLKSPQAGSVWLAWGGVQALESYGVRPYGARGLREAEALAAELRFALQERGHEGFFNTLALSHTIGGYIFVHAGVRAGLALEKQMRSDLLFIREDFVGRPHHLPGRVVFGHTIFANPLVEADRIGLDTGAFQSHILTAAVLEDTDVRFLQTAQ